MQPQESHSGSRLLDGRVAIVYGAGGQIGGAVSRAFARAGATVHLAGRTAEPVEQLAVELRAAGWQAEPAVVDALDEEQVERHAAAVVEQSGRIDISLNVIGIGEVMGTPLVDMSLADFERPIHLGVRTAFLTARAAARQMSAQGSGVLLFFGGTGDPVRGFGMGGFQVALQAVDHLQKQFAAELGPRGVRTVMIQTGGVLGDTPADPVEAAEFAQIAEMVTADTMLGRAALLEDVGNVAVFAASEHARTITAANLNISAGAILP
ncbi:SDR family NAD(P)-dependent oxidoreductase [Microterricola viridarii]|uniref:NAD(P)-dependent dehydrogenase, short-chain alcohol dehydrogenase family n=1 Tax=Microterricola viridarii TaxID=412690 RepID=A0A1H1XXD7_9MICO|nr:SDR family oxidoreductase [Microterricola viridarii]SDT13938.1 NAD(P)-dependent dehydrogenase, short-chain alcohol dehydrogenase family [Microterricola viridarii]